MAWGRYSLHMLCHFNPCFQVSKPVWVCCISTPIFCKNWEKCLVLNPRFVLVGLPPPPIMSRKGVNFGRYIWLNVFGICIWIDVFVFESKLNKIFVLVIQNSIFLYKFVFVFVRGETIHHISDVLVTLGWGYISRYTQGNENTTRCSSISYYS